MARKCTICWHPEREAAVLAERGYGKLTDHIKVDLDVASGIVERLQAARKRVSGGATNTGGELQTGPLGESRQGTILRVK